MTGPTDETILDALRTVAKGGDGGRDIVAAGMVEGLVVRNTAVRFAIRVDPAQGAGTEPLRRAAEAAVKRVPGVRSVNAVLTGPDGAPIPRAGPPKGAPPDLGVGARAKDAPRPAPPPKDSGPVDGVERIIAIGSGKGGVGKSTVSANLAVALAMEGWRVGLLDSDVYGPSQPRMLGIDGRPFAPDDETIVPLLGYGVKCMSMGFLTGEAESVIWRGPMLMTAVTQMLYQVAWKPLDFLIVDLPPGTGDVQLTLSQKTKVAGAVIVSTPQDVALLDARKAIDMFAKIRIPILGVIENMASFHCPDCGSETPIFGHGGAEAEAEKIGAPFLGRIPIALEIRTTSDEGTPIVAAMPESAEALRFREMAREIAAGVGAHAPGEAAYRV